MNEILRKSLCSVVLGPLFLIPGLGLLGIFISLINLSTFEDFWGMTTLYLVYGVVGLMFAYPAAIVYGLPLMLTLRKFGKLTLPFLLIISLLPASILLGVVAPSLLGWLLYSYSSVVVALGCWYVFKWA